MKSFPTRNPKRIQSSKIFSRSYPKQSFPCCYVTRETGGVIACRGGRSNKYNNTWPSRGIMDRGKQLFTATQLTEVVRMLGAQPLSLHMYFGQHSTQKWLQHDKESKAIPAVQLPLQCILGQHTETNTTLPHLKGLKLVVDVLAKEGDVEEVEGLSLRTALSALIGSFPKAYLLPQQGKVRLMGHKTKHDLYGGSERERRERGGRKGEREEGGGMEEGDGGRGEGGKGRG